MNRLVIAAPQSGAGKTTVCLGLLAALSRRGVRVQPFKAGPDFIDPGLHQCAAGVVSHNLDTWMLSREENLALFLTHTEGKDLAIVEGVMGLFDGRDGTAGTIPPGSTAELALWLDAPVVLVIDVQGQGQSVAAVIKGFEEFHPRLHIAGVIFNRAGSARHIRLLTRTVEMHCRARVLGSIPRQAEIAIPERYLGLQTADDFERPASFWERLADLMAEYIDLDAILTVANTANKLPRPPRREDTSRQGQRIRLGVARDAAFCFFYHDNFQRLRDAGAELVFFSPLADAGLPGGLDALWIGGGYPELRAEALAANVTMRADIRRFAAAGRPIYAECGGLMYLCKTLLDTTGLSHPMVGVFPFATRMTPRWRALGYREITATTGNPFFPPGVRLRGHEFHYSEIAEEAPARDWVQRTLLLQDSHGSSYSEGFTIRRTLGTYAHIHFGSQPDAARYFVDSIATISSKNLPLETTPCR
ncbi:MAG: cobyrinate a,c-diamide synthase [Candidatus Binatia bacterium]|nr:cobyrinate a,c-diamide synthase [Candidatus Binatia bacterium]